MKEADMIIFMIDAKTDIMPQEKELAKHMRRITVKPVILVANKIDTQKIETNWISGEWRKLGMGEPIGISASSGRNTGDLLDHIFSLLQKTKSRPKIKKENDIEPIRVSLVGKPNVGKSSLFNKLIGEEKVIVNDLPHTTREPHDTEITYLYEQGGKQVKQKITFIDTAGIRRKTKVGGGLESIGIYKSIKTIEESDIILFIIDGSEPISSQDMQLGGLLEKRAKSVILLVNKWDLVEDNSDHKRHEVEKMVRSYLPHLDFAPIIFVSGKSGYRVHQIMPSLIHAWSARHIEIPTDTLHQFLRQMVKNHLPTRGKGTRHPEIKTIQQINVNPPVIELLIKYRTSLHLSYVNYLKNKIREKFDFYATPIIIRLTKMKR